MSNVGPLSSFALGTSRLASLGSRLSRRQIQDLFSTALELGVTTFDTADTYGSGDSERSVAMGLGANRHKAFVVTKGGYPFVNLPSWCSPFNQVGKKLRQKMHARQNFSRRYLLNACEKSLQRLKSDHIDAYLLHEPQNMPDDEAWEALRTIRQTGRARLTGLSSNALAVVEAGVASGEVAIVETSMSHLAQDRFRILDLCLSRGIKVLANEVLSARALLHAPKAQWSASLKERGLPSISPEQALVGIAGANPAISSVLIGTRSPSHLKRNIEPFHDLDTISLLVSSILDGRRC